MVYRLMLSIPNSPIGVDTMDDFMEIKKIMEYKKIKFMKIVYQGS